MGFGQHPFGTHPFGADPVAPVSAPAPAPITQAPLFQIAQRGFPQDADGRLLAVHPVDQEVSIALGVEEGAIASATEIGHRIRRIARAGGPNLAAEVNDAVKIALARPLARQDIKILGVDIDAKTVRGRIVVVVRYVNLRTGTKQSAKVR